MGVVSWNKARDFRQSVTNTHVTTSVYEGEGTITKQTFLKIPLIHVYEDFQLHCFLLQLFLDGTLKHYTNTSKHHK